MLRHPPGTVAAFQKIHPRRAEAAVGDVGGHHRVTVRSQHPGHRAVAAAGFPDRAAQPDVPQQRLGDPGGVA